MKARAKQTTRDILAIGSSHVAAARFSTSATGRLRLERIAREEFPPVSENDDTWPAGLDAALASVVAQVGIKRDVHLVVPGHLTLVKWITTPAVESAKWARIVEFEVRQNIPFPLAEIVWDHRVLGESNGEINVVLAASKRELIEGLTTKVTELGPRPVTVAPAGLALESAFRVLYSEISDDVLVVAAGARTAHLLMVEPRGFLMRTLPLAGNAITRDIAGRLDQSFADAERLKRNVLGGALDLPPDSPAAQAVTTAATAFSNRLSAEVSRTLVNFTRQSGRPRPSRCLIAGEGITRHDFAQKLGEKCQLEVSVFSVQEGIDMDDETRERAAGVPAGTLAELVGAAHAARGQEDTINLCPPALIEAGAAQKRRGRYVMAVAMLGAGFLLPGVHFNLLARAREQRAAEISRATQPYYAWRDQNRENLRRLEAATAEAAVLTRLVGIRGQWASLLADVQARLQDVGDVWLERVQRLPTNERNRREPEYDEFGDVIERRSDPTRLRVSGRLLDRQNPLERVSQSSYERVTTLLDQFRGSDYIESIEGERFDAGKPGILRFDFTLVLNAGRSW